MAETNQTSQKEIDRLLNELNKEEVDFKKDCRNSTQMFKNDEFKQCLQIYDRKKKLQWQIFQCLKFLLVAQKAYFLGCNCNGQK